MKNEYETYEQISVVVPCYNEESALPYFYTEIREAADRLSAAYKLCFEILFVDDGSKDHTLELLRSYAGKDGRIHYISFSRNFGKEAAIYAGFQHSKGDYVVLMDADLQHPPAMLEEMYLALKGKEYDIAAAKRISREGEPPIRSFFARRFYRLINKLSEAEFVDGASDFRMLSRRAADALLKMGEYNRFSKGIFGWLGFRTKWLPYKNVERVAGETKWSFGKLFKYSLEGITAFSTAPLAIAAVMGVVLCLVALFLALYVIMMFVIGDRANGWTLLICVIILVSGIQLLCTGVLAQYLAKTYWEVKKRPIYIVGETNEDIDVG